MGTTNGVSFEWQQHVIAAPAAVYRAFSAEAGLQEWLCYDAQAARLGDD